MPVKAEVRGITPPEFEVIGTGTIGEKARQLQEKTPKLKEIGWHIPRRTALANSYFTDFLSANGVSMDDQAPGLEERVRSGRFAEGQHATLQKVIGSHGRKPLVVRSSGEGDARGTGIYKSEFVDGTIEGINRGVREVYASYFSSDAIAFRKDAGLEDGFGVIIEPIVGQQIGGVGIAPLLSGYGYSSAARLRAMGSFTSVVPGLGGGVNSRDNQIVDRKDGDISLWEYIANKRMNVLGSGDPERMTSLLGITDEFEEVTKYLKGKKFVPGGAGFDKEAKSVIVNGIIIPDIDVLDDISLNKFFEMTARMDEEFGGTQYFEWAMTYEGGEPKFHILQIDDYTKDQGQEVAFGKDKPILEAKSITGTGTKECPKIFIVNSGYELDALRRFNAENEGYVLIFPNTLTISWIALSPKIRYSDFSNAAVVIEIPDGRHASTPVSHFGGQIEATGKFFGVLDWEKDPDWEGFEDMPDGPGIYNGKVLVTASGTEDRLVISRLNE